ncbi:MAG: SDR family oxidoreductase [Anaerolineae bacterium]
MNVLITGASRGIGLELVRQYAARGEQVFAAARNPDGAHELERLRKLYQVTIVPLNVVDDESIRAAVQVIKGKTESLDLLFNNAAINPETPPYESFGQLQAEAMLQVLHTNTVAPLLVAQAIMPLLSKGTHPKLINISSEMGSVSGRSYGGSHSYCMSKAALNMASRGLAYDLRRQNVVVVALDPGWVQTDMGGAGASLTPHESVSGIVRVVDGLTMKDSGKFLDYRGGQHQW